MVNPEAPAVPISNKNEPEQPGPNFGFRRQDIQMLFRPDMKNQ